MGSFERFTVFYCSVLGPGDGQVQVLALKQFNGYIYSFHDKEILKQILRFSKHTNSE